MKNKKLTYLLIVLLIVVWGLIVYKVIGALTGDDDSYPDTPTRHKKEVYNDYQIPKDTTRLQQNYRDPFGLVQQKDTIKSNIAFAGTSKTSRHIPPPETNWNFIRYIGYIKNPGSKKMISILHINGQEVLLADGESASQVTLIKNMRDSIKINYKSKTKYISIKPAAI